MFLIFAISYAYFLIVLSTYCGAGLFIFLISDVIDYIAEI